MNVSTVDAAIDRTASKPGRLTSEFWLVVAVGGLLLLDGSGLVSIAPDDLRWYAGLIGVYAGGRSYVKRRESVTPDTADGA